MNLFWKKFAGLIHTTAVSKTILAALFVAIGTFSAKAQPIITFEPDAFGVITADEVNDKLDAEFGTPASYTEVYENPNRAKPFTAEFENGTSVIGEFAFMWCHSMELTSLPAGLVSIGQYGLQGCWSITSITLPSGITSIPNDVFAFCINLASIKLPSGITNIGTGAFESCNNLQSITILGSTPPTLNTGGVGLFLNVPNTCKVYVPVGAVSAYVNSAWNTYFAGRILEFSVPTITFMPDGSGEITFYEVEAKLDAQFPAGNPGGSTGYYNPNRLEPFIAAFGNGTTAIGDNAFLYCKNIVLTSLPSGIKSIGTSAFQECTNLALTSLPSGLTSIGNQAFAHTNLALTSLPSGVTSIGNHAFTNCSNLALTSLPAGIKNIESGAFHSCSNLALTSLPAGLTIIEGYTFYYCSNLKTMTLPAGITSIGQQAFEWCENLQSVIILRSDPPTLWSDAFQYIPRNTLSLYVPNLTALDKYKNDADWYAVFGDSIFVISSEPSSDEEPGIDEYEFLYGDAPDGQVVEVGNPMKNKFKVSFGHIRDADKNTKFRVIYEIKNSKGRTIYKNETITSKAELEETNYDLEKIYNLRASGNGQGTIILTIKNMKGKVLSTQSKTFTVVNIPPRIISVKKKK